MSAVYQIYPRSFLDRENRDGNGDLAGIIRKLDYLKDLGIDAIWMSPVYDSPMVDGGYDVSNYLDINPMYGDLEKMDELIAKAHGHDMAVMMDFVPNHTSDQHPWFLESRSSKDNQKRNWYHWKPGKDDGSKPNNWITVFDNTPGSAWTLDETTDEYYLHSFFPEQPDLNWDNPEVVNAMHDTLNFWMDRGVNGFRIDVGLYIVKDPEYPDEPLNPDYKEGEMHPNEILLHTASKDQPAAFEKLSEMGNLVGQRGGFSVHEVYVRPEQRALLYKLSADGLSTPFNFDLILNGWNAQDVRKAIFGYYSLLKDADIVPLPLGNHDQSRVATRLGGQKDARIAAMLQMTLECLPFIYQGEEIGMEDLEIPKKQQVDPFQAVQRDSFRTPMQWDNSPNAGFCEEGVDPWLPVNPDYKERNVQQQLEDPSSMHALYKKLLTLRKDDLKPGRPIEIDVKNDNVISFKRKTNDGKNILVILNFSENEEKVSLYQEQGTLLLTTSLDRKRGEFIDLSNTTLQPKEGYILTID